MAISTDKIRARWTASNIITRLITVNVLLFIIIRLGDIICNFASADQAWWLQIWAMPSDMANLAIRPWTPILYMFAQFDVLHLLFNMLWLYGFGTIMLQMSTPRQVFGLYIYGGLGGAAAFLAGMTLTGLDPAPLIGSSASVMCIVAAIATTAPQMPVRMFIIGEVKILWVAIAALLLFTVCGDPSNAGGQLAHIGSAATGFIYGLLLRRGHDITAPFNHAADWVVTRIRHPFRGSRPAFPKVKPFKGQRRKASSDTQKEQPPKKSTSISREDQDELDSILDKIKLSGYTALSAEEKRRLFEVSQRIK